MWPQGKIGVKIVTKRTASATDAGTSLAAISRHNGAALTVQLNRSRESDFQIQSIG
jgi:hypothetical protein